MTTRLEKVIADIDAINAKDPNLIDQNGSPRPKEMVFSEWLENWILKLNPKASEYLRIAARGQHVGRWKIPREKFPMDRGGYLRWREELKRVHAKTVSAIMNRHNYSPEERNRVEDIVMKKNIKSNPDAQAIEDGLCLVFLEKQFSDLESKTSQEKMIGILQKTWRKMSPKGQAAALKLSYTPTQKNLINQALQE